MIRAIAASLLLVTPALAEPPKIVADIPPVHALVAQVMQGVGEPFLLLPPGTSPHGYSMRPSEAQALEEAEVVFWIGHALTPWMERPLEANAGNAHTIEFMELAGLTLHEFRTGATFEAHDHGDEHRHGDEQGHGDHAEAKDDHDEHAHDKHDHGDHGHAEKNDHNEHAHDKHDHGDHGHDEHAHDKHDEKGHDEQSGDEHGDEHDPHIWLDPVNAAVMIDAIADELAEHDPANASTYRSNAEKAKADLDALRAEVAEIVAPADGKSFIVFHDAYHYFEHRFGIEAAGAISIGDATTPGARRLAEIRDLIEDTETVCVFAEPQYNPARVATVTEATDARIGVLDPLGAEITPGPGAYKALVRGLATSLAECLTAEAG